jgi:hypothetical protein
MALLCQDSAVQLGSDKLQPVISYIDTVLLN